jgi:hypothetical protein
MTMTLQHQEQLSRLLAASNKMQTEEEIHIFGAEWHSFLATLSPEEGKIACDAYFETLFGNLQKVENLAQSVLENGTEADRLFIIEELDKLKEPLLQHKIQAIAA